jgi:hypothetical protein
MIKLADGRGHLYQWDTGRQVECDAEQVHFSNHHYGASIDVDIKDGKAMIPNQLLTSAIPLKAWAWVKDSSGEYTKEEQIFLVAKRNKPSDYVYTPTEIKTWQDLQNQIGDLNDLKTKHKDNLVNAINDAAGSGGAGDFVIKMTVEVNGDNYTVTSCDKTMEQIDAAVTSGQNIKAIAFDKYIMPLIQIKYGESYTFGAFLGSFLVAATVAKNPESGADDWQFYLAPITADIVNYSNAAMPNISTVEEALDELVAKSHSPAYYVDLAGTYPNYTSPVTMDDIKTAYNSGYNLVCRCTLGAYTATLPLFIPMPAANTWIFSGSGALKSMGFDAQSFTVAITANGVVAQQTPLNKPLNITAGGKIYTYDGSNAVSVAVKTEANSVTTSDGNIALADNTEYRLADVTTLTLTYPTRNFECWMRLNFAASGNVTVTLPTGTKYIGTAPDFKNGETWELSFKDKVLAAQKVGEGI